MPSAPPRSTPWFSRPRLAGRILLAALLLFVAGRCLVPMDETDLFFNLRLGDIVLDSGRIPTTNLLSYTFPDVRDVNLAWAFQVVLALAYKAGGITGTVLLKTAFAMATLGVLFAVARRRGAHPAVAAAALALTAWTMEPRFVERPHLVTFLGLALVLLVIERAEADRPRRLWWLVPPGLVWANANSCFFEAPLVLLLYAAGAALDAALAPRAQAPAPDGDADAEEPPPPSTPLPRMAWLALAVGAALLPLIFATPSGTHALGYIANHWRMPWLRPLQEYRVTNLWPEDAPAVFMLGALVLGGALAPRALRLRWLMPIALVAFVAWRRNRFVAEAALLTGPVVAVLWTRAIERAATRLPRLDVAEFLHGLGAVAVGAGLLTLTAWPRVSAARHQRPWLDLGMESELRDLVAPADFMLQQGAARRMYNDMEVGSYIAWKGWPRVRVFQDPRINGYPDAFHAIMRRGALPQEEWDALLDRFGVTSALISYPGENPRAGLFDPDKWAAIHRSKGGLGFVRRIPEYEKVIKANEIPIRFKTGPEGTLEEPLERQPKDSPIRSCEWQRRLGEFFIEKADVRRAWQAYRLAVPEGDDSCIDADAKQATKIALGGLAMQLQNPSVAADLYKGLGDPESLSNRAFALLALKKWEEALGEFDEALKLAPATSEAHYGRGVALMALTRKREAIEALKQFLTLAPSHMAAADARGRLESMGVVPPGPPPGPPPDHGQ